MTARWALVAAMVMIGPAHAVPPKPPAISLTPLKPAPALSVDHSTGDLSQWPNFGMVSGGKAKWPWAQTVVPVDGNLVGRFEVREGMAGPNTKVRSEVGDTSVKKSSEWWYSWRTQISPEWKDNNSTWYTVAQFHQAPPLWRGGDWGPPPLQFRYSGGQWRILEWFYDEDHQKTPIYLAAGAQGVWVHWRVHAVWRGDSSGVLQIWRDGKLVVDRRGKNLNGDGGGGTFFKLGVYRGYGDPNTQVIYHDDYRRGLTRESVN